MGFKFDKNLYNEQVRQKYMEAERNRDEVYRAYPEIKKVDKYIQRLKKEERLLQARLIFNKDSDSVDEMKESIADIKEEIEALTEKYNQLLEEYNVPHNFKEPDWDCPHCMDTGRVVKNGVTLPCRCTFKKRRKVLLNRSGLPKRLSKANFNDLDLGLYSTDPMGEDSPTVRENAKLVFEAAKNFAYNFEESKDMKGLLIEGNVGSGKSYLLGCIANYLINRDIEVRYIVYGDLIQRIKSSFSSNSKISTEEILKELQDVSVLLIDDLGTEHTTEFTSSTLYQIIDKRYREELPVIVTTNFSPNELSDRMGLMGERIFYRLVEKCDFYQLLGDVRDRIALSRQGDDQ